MRTKQDLPVTFQTEIVTSILRYIAAGDSCSIVGIGSVGKSNLLRFLQREDVRRAYLDEEWNTYLFIYIDLNKLLKQSLWGLLELMLHQLMVELTNSGADEVIRQTIDDLHQRATQPKTRYLTLRYLDRAVGLVCNQLGLRLVFLIDEFDELCHTMSPRGFAALRAIRDDYKQRLAYVIATRMELKRLRQEIVEIEAFEELVSPHTLWLGPYAEDDARFMLSRLEARHDFPLEDKTINELLLATGGHPGLLREAYQVSREHSHPTLEILVGNSRVQDECRRIWLSLLLEEQQVLVNLANEATIQPYQIDLLERLRRKGLVGGPWTTPDHIFSPFLAEFIRQQNPVVGAHIHIDHNRRTVWVNGREVQELTQLEYKLISYLDKKRDQVCSRDELAHHLYPDDIMPEGSGVTDTRLDSIVKRLRKRIEFNPKEPGYIITVRGHGFRLVDSPEAEYKD